MSTEPEPRPRMEIPDLEPAQDAGQGEWNAYVAAGRTREDRRARLAQCPEHLRPAVERHVRSVYRLRSRA